MKRTTQQTLFGWSATFALVAGLLATYIYYTARTVQNREFTQAFGAFLAFAVLSLLVSLVRTRPDASEPAGPGPPWPEAAAPPVASRALSDRGDHLGLPEERDGPALRFTDPADEAEYWRLRYRAEQEALWRLWREHEATRNELARVRPDPAPSSPPPSPAAGKNAASSLARRLDEPSSN